MARCVTLVESAAFVIMDTSFTHLPHEPRPTPRVSLGVGQLLQRL